MAKQQTFKEISEETLKELKVFVDSLGDKLTSKEKAEIVRLATVTREYAVNAGIIEGRRTSRQ